MSGKRVVKRVRFHGDAKERLSGFPDDVREDLGHNLFQVQNGRDPADWKPMNTVGPNVKEIRARNADGTWRVIYLATLPDLVHVFHAFEERTRKTSQHDINVARERYQELMRSLKQ